jgi:sugar phosphate isomerase/epimerase
VLAGLNPYGVSYAAGLMAAGTPRAHPAPLGVDGFIALARGFGARCIELDHRWLTPCSDAELARIGETLGPVVRICSFWLAQQPGETLDDAIRCTRGVGATLLRLHLTPVLEGARAACGPRWQQMVAHARETLARESPKVAAAGLTLAIENHQDFGSEELMAIVSELGEHAGIVLDTGNPFAVGEDPVEFTRRAADRIRHVHLKDYVAQFTDEGYRLVRCAIGDGCVPFKEMFEVLGGRCDSMTASLEPGALEARHIRIFTNEWWHGYPERDAREVAAMLGRLRRRRLPEDADYRTPWELGSAPEDIAEYELHQLQCSFKNLAALRVFSPGTTRG